MRIGLAMNWRAGHGASWPGRKLRGNPTVKGHQRRMAAHPERFRFWYSAFCRLFSPSPERIPAPAH
jgi:hypothetical protein